MKLIKDNIAPLAIAIVLVLIGLEVGRAYKSGCWPWADHVLINGMPFCSGDTIKLRFVFPTDEPGELPNARSGAAPSKQSGI